MTDLTKPRSAHAGLLAALLPAALLAACASALDTPPAAERRPSSGADRYVLDTAEFDATLQRRPTTALSPAPVAPPAPALSGPTRLTLYFDFGRTRLGAEQAAALERFAREADRRRRWRVKASTDPTGAPQVNRRLAHERADHVIERLVALGLDRSTMTAVPVAAAAKAVTGAAPATGARARRVDIEADEG